MKLLICLTLLVTQNLSASTELATYVKEFSPKKEWVKEKKVKKKKHDFVNGIKGTTDFNKATPGY